MRGALAAGGANVREDCARPPRCQCPLGPLDGRPYRGDPDPPQGCNQWACRGENKADARPWSPRASTTLKQQPRYIPTTPWSGAVTAGGGERTRKDTYVCEVMVSGAASATTGERSSANVTTAGAGGGRTFVLLVAEGCTVEEKNRRTADTAVLSTEHQALKTSSEELGEESSSGRLFIGFWTARRVVWTP